MKIRFWEKDNVSKYAIVLALIVCYPLLNYFTGQATDWAIIFLGTFIFVLCFFLDFLPNFFNYIVRVENNNLIIKDGILRNPISIETDGIESIYISEINLEKTVLTIALTNGEEIYWKTRSRTKEIYNELISLYPQWNKNESV